MDSIQELVWTWIKGKDFTISVQFRHSSPLEISLPSPITEGAFQAFFFFQYEEFLWLQLLGSLSQGYLLHALWELPNINCSNLAEENGWFFLSLWKFLLYEPTLLQKSLSWEFLSQRKYGTAVIWHVVSFFFWILLMVYNTSNSTVAPKQSRRRLKPYSRKCILQDFIRSADSGHFFGATLIWSCPMSSRILLTFSNWF